MNASVLLLFYSETVKKMKPRKKSNNKNWPEQQMMKAGKPSEAVVLKRLLITGLMERYKPKSDFVLTDDTPYISDIFLASATPHEK